MECAQKCSKNVEGVCTRVGVSGAVGVCWMEASEGEYNRLLTLPSRYDDDEYVNDLTREMDLHIIGTRLPYICTHVYHPVLVKGNMYLRFEGGIVGFMVLDKNCLITKVVLNETAVIYKPEVTGALQHFIGSKIVLKDV